MDGSLSTRIWNLWKEITITHEAIVCNSKPHMHGTRLRPLYTKHIHGHHPSLQFFFPRPCFLSDLPDCKHESWVLEQFR